MPGNLPHSPAQILKQLLIDEEVGVAEATPPAAHEDWTIFNDNEPPRPNSIITVTDTSGKPFLGDSHGGRNEHDGVQIMVRGGTHPIAWAKANEIKVWVDNYKTVGPQFVLLGGYPYCVGLIYRSGSILRMGPEPNSTRRRFSVNILMHATLDL